MQSPYQTAQRLALAGMAVSAALALLKVFVGLEARSTAVLADGVESAVDVVGSGIVFFGLTVASRPADENHPYGHGRFEILSGLMAGMLLVLTGAAISVVSYRRLGHSDSIPAAYAIWALVISMAAKLTMSVLKSRAARKVGSIALQADAKHDAVDIASGATALLAVGLTLFNPAWHEADHIGGILVGCFVMFLGVQVMRETAYHLTDTMPDDAMMQQIRAAALSVEGALGIEKCFARKTGFRYHVDLHLQVDSQLTVARSHELAGAVKTAIRGRLPWVDNVLVHVEPLH